MTAREFESRSLKIDDLDYPILETGSGPLVILLHGFPDNYDTFAPQMQAIAQAGFRAVAPMLPGYAVTNQRKTGPHDPIYVRDQLNRVVCALLEEDKQSRCHLVAHDWGAVIGYLMVQDRPEIFSDYASLGIPAGMSWLKIMTRCPTYFVNAFYITIFQIPVFSEWLFRRDNFRFMRWLIGIQSPRMRNEHAFLDNRANTMSQPGVIKAAFSYYRNSFYGLNKVSFSMRRLLSKPMEIPVLAIRGEEDFGNPESLWECISPKQFKAGLTLKSIQSAGHFFHLEEPERVNRLLVSWLNRD